ncbi:MAG: PEP-CTERM-box response regulator transcription factor [Pseudomonadota bacterium]
MSNKTDRKLLIVDDDEGLQRQLRWAFDDCEVAVASDRESALAALAKHKPPVVLLDLGLPPDANGPSEGLATLEEILASAPDSKVIMVSGQTEREYAIRAVGLGAYDFYQKPIEVEVLKLIVQRAFNFHALEQENRRLASGVGDPLLPGVITANLDMMKIAEDVKKFAATDVTVLVTGESGTGKELMARAVHLLSARAEGPFVAINCAAIPEQLLESELFGHEKGAFTGAVKTTLGKVEVASGGTLFLDEIGDMPMALQAKLLRFTEERTIERIGGRDQIPINTRVVSATNKDLPVAIKEGTFREDLFYRLAETIIDVPPLRDRQGDALVVAHHLLHKQSEELGRPIQGFSSDAVSAILTYSWPGNIRELQNRIKRAVVTASGKNITVEDLELAQPSDEDNACLTLKECRERAERTAIVRAMVQANGNVSKAAKLLDTSRPTLYQMLRQFDIKAGIPGEAETAEAAES